MNPDAKLSAALLTPALVLALVVALSVACGESAVERRAREMTGGDPGHGLVLVRKYGCNGCHMVPGMPGAKTGAVAGPAFDGVGSRPSLAGKLPNTPQNLMRWIRDPQSVSRGTQMPNLRVSEQDSRDLAAFLYTLR
jgi:cytochrome c1